METEAQELLASGGAAAGKTSVEAFERLVASDFLKWSSLARARGLSVN